MSQTLRCPRCERETHGADLHCIHCGLRLNVAGYQVTRRLGAGGMGEVFLGFQPALDRSVAIKIVSPDKQGSSAFRERFLREARIMASLDHENIVRLHHFDELDGQLFLITELVEGATLKTPAGSVKIVSLEELLVARQEHGKGPVSVEFSVELLRGMLKALEYAHSRANPIIHRDIKPGNILLTPSGQPKLADFGISKFGGETGSDLTGTGTLLGTEDYMAPEQFYNHLGSVSDRSDLYSLGLTIYQALAGVSPEGLRGRLAGHLPDAREHNSAVPKELAAVLARALQFKPEDRYGSAREMRSELESAVEGLKRSSDGENAGGLTQHVVATRPPPSDFKSSVAGRAPSSPGERDKEEDVVFVDTPSVPETEFETPKCADSFNMKEVNFDHLESLDTGGEDATSEDDLLEPDMGTDELQGELPSMDLDLPMPDAVQARAAAQDRPRRTRKKKGVLGLVLTLVILVVGGGAAFHFGVFDSPLSTKPLPPKKATPKAKRSEFGPHVLGAPRAYDRQLKKLVRESENASGQEVEIGRETMWVLAWYQFLFPEAFGASRALGEQSLPAELQKLTKTHVGAVFKAKIESMQLASTKEWAQADARFSEYLNLKAKKMAELLEKNQLTAVVAREDNLLSAWFAVENGRFDEAQGLLQDLIGEKAGELYPSLLLARTHAGKATRLEATGKGDQAQAERNRAIDRLMEVVEKYPATTDAKLLLSGLLAREDKLDQALVLAQECLDEGKKTKNLFLQVQSYGTVVRLLQKKQDEDELLRTLEEMKMAVMGKKAGIEEPEDLLLILCGLYIKKNRIQQALGALELCSSCDSAEFFLLHATTYERSKLYHTAVEKAKLGHDKYPDHAGLLMMLARLSQQTGQSNSAVAYLEQILKLKPDNLDAAVTLAKLFLELNDPSNARRVLLEAERFVQGSSQLQEMLAKINEAMGDDAGTISALRKLIEIKGDDKLRKKLAKYLVKQGSYEEALVQFEVLSSKNLITHDLRQGYAKSLKATGRIQDAVDELKELFKDDPGDRETARFLADIYLQKEDFFNAKFYLEAARRADSKNAEIHYLIGTSCLKLQEDDCAVEAFRQAVELEPEKLEYAELFANQLFKMSKGMKGKELKGAYRQARKYFDFIIARYENDPTISKDRHNADVYFNRGKILFDTGHFAKALKDLDKALFLAKHRFDILVTFADTLYKMNRYDDALKYYQEMIDSDVDLPHAYYYRGHIFLTTGKREKAKANLLKCIARDAKRFPDAHRLLGNIFKIKGLRKKARDHYSIFLRLVGSRHPAVEEVRSSLSKL